ncbi:immune inhibitor A domain-containing protein [Neobacillus sp. PS3-40]|uniref:immune inhibitor A domain-containing protein n=1 Tax=Neobacillus sp. PS3-40 TaxID=3070679 RepID=UPI0027DF0A14|nr:immune inhibitor A domain-containing protein [Neobacillus sp. PS3-40]WML46326.1 immune inhibitor A [Neobacillus sp. PS3-40]
MDWKKKLGIPLFSAGLVFSAFAPGAFSQGKLPASILNSYTNEVAPGDLAIANDERLIEMLKKNGTIAKDATPAEADKALQQYLHKMAVASKTAKTNDSLGKKRDALTEQIKEKMDSNGVNSGKGNKVDQAKQGAVSSVQGEKWDGQQRKDEVLVLLIDFPDVPHGQLTADETDMYYSGADAYSHQHYQDMIFGKDGYVGPDGKTKISMKQFYEQQSGGSYTVDGEVAGWYTASHPAAYYGAHSGGGNDVNPRALIKEVLAAAAKDPSVNLNNYDQEDPYDLDGDGNTREPDGLIDHVMVIHSGVGEEAGGGQIGPDAIWSHSWDLGGVATIPNTQTDVPYWGGLLGGFAYTVEPEDGAAGVFAHEFGHNLGLPDEYDTLYSGSGEPVSYWSIMSSGSWTGKVPGTEPSGFSPYDKEFLQQSMTTGEFIPNWQTGNEVNSNDVTSKGSEFLLDEASTKGTNNDVVKVDLPIKVTDVNTPTSGVSEYFSGSADNLSNNMTTTVDLTNATSAQLTFKTWYSIEKDYDYATIRVNGKTIPGNLTTNDDPYGSNPGSGITGDSNGWVDATFDLSQFAGQKVQLSFNYDTDGGLSKAGFYVDDVKVTAGGNAVLSDDAEGTSPFAYDGFTKSNGKSRASQYYLLEWRSHNGSDAGLANVNRKGTMLSYDQGLVVWYVDNSFNNNWTGPEYHPGDGFLGVVDADQHNNIWHYKDWTDPNGYYDVNKLLGSNSYQMHDAAFSLNKGSNVTIGDPTFYLKDNFTQSNALFDDSQNYLNAQDPDVGRNIPHLGLKVRVVGQSDDGTVGKILLYR